MYIQIENVLENNYLEVFIKNTYSCACMKGYMYIKVYEKHEIRIFRTMGAWLETSTKYIFSHLSQCCIPKWPSCLFKTTLQCKTKKATIKNNREVATGAL